MPVIKYKKSDRMTVETAKRKLGLASDADLARKFKVSRNCVYLWKQRGFIGYDQAKQIRAGQA